jgi:hypothetical protein
MECESLSVTLRDEHRLRAIEKRVLRRIFGPKRDEMTAGWTKIQSSPNIVMAMKRRTNKILCHLNTYELSIHK